jgi:hypothetical protein
MPHATPEFHASLALRFALFVGSSLLLVSCREGARVEPAPHVPPQFAKATVEDLAGKSVFFGHQSVGANILEGVRDLERDGAGAGLAVIRLVDPKDMKGPGLFHAPVGENDDPVSKIRSFQRIVEGGVGEAADIAFFKFCYVDIVWKTDVRRLFEEYRRVMTGLRRQYPRVTFVHVTVPLATTTPWPKAQLKRLLGRDENNINRSKFNDLLREEYRGREPVFDLAKVESTRPGGGRATYIQGDKVYESLAAEYTDDGGHLNAVGRIVVARELLRFLESL